MVFSSKLTTKRCWWRDQPVFAMWVLAIKVAIHTRVNKSFQATSKLKDMVWALSRVVFRLEMFGKLTWRY